MKMVIFLHFLLLHQKELPPFACSREIGYASKIRLPLKKLIPPLYYSYCPIGILFYSKGTTHYFRRVTVKLKKQKKSNKSCGCTLNSTLVEIFSSLFEAAPFEKKTLILGFGANFPKLHFCVGILAHCASGS